MRFRLLIPRSLAALSGHSSLPVFPTLEGGVLSPQIKQASKASFTNKIRVCLRDLASVKGTGGHLIPTSVLSEDTNIQKSRSKQK